MTDMNLPPRLAPSLQVWLDRERAAASRLDSHSRSFPSGKCLSGHVLDQIGRIPGLVKLENAWGAGLGSARNKQMTWIAMLSNEAAVPSDSESGYLLRYGSDPRLMQLPHPYVPPAYCLSDPDCFVRYVCESMADWHIARSWSEHNQLALTQLLRLAIGGAYPHIGSRYMNLGSRYVAEFAIVLPQGDSGLAARSQWTSQSVLFKAVAALFPDAIAEYTPVWLGSQRIDIYIPSKRVAIEYQGEQHYRPIRRFGGLPGLKATKERDRRKAALCKENGIALIWWRYDDEVSTKNIASRVTRAGR